jgi:hypothetical protein
MTGRALIWKERIDLGYNEENRSSGAPVMHTILATFEDGMLKPAEPLNLPAHAEVRLTIEVLPSSPLTVGKLEELLRSLPAMGDDAEKFAADVKAIRAQFPAESSAWD